MNRQSFPEEIDAQKLNSDGRYVFRGCDASTSRQLSRAAQLNEDIQNLADYLNEESEHEDGNELYVLTNDKYNSYISSAVAHIGRYGMNIYWLDDDERDAYESDFTMLLHAQVEAQYPQAS